MHSSLYTQLAQTLDERGEVVAALLPSFPDFESAVVVGHNPDAPDQSFAYSVYDAHYTGTHFNLGGRSYLSRREAFGLFNDAVRS